MSIIKKLTPEIIDLDDRRDLVELITLKEARMLAGVSKSKMANIAAAQLNGFPPLVCVSSSRQNQYDKAKVLAWLSKNDAKTLAAPPQAKPAHRENGPPQIDNSLAFAFITGAAFSRPKQAAL